MMVDDAEEGQFRGPIDVLAPTVSPDWRKRWATYARAARRPVNNLQRRCRERTRAPKNATALRHPSLASSSRAIEQPSVWAVSGQAQL
jgi:hypothetical protein